MLYDQIPNELKVLKRWCCWSGDKIPKNARTGNGAMSNNPDTWSDFETAAKAVDKFKFSGVGFMLSPPYFGVDLDHCLDDQALIDEFVKGLQSYTEISQSGNGLHIICRGTLPKGRRRKGNVEMYSENRYFIMTGNVYNGFTNISECTNSIIPLYNKYLKTEVQKQQAYVMPDEMNTDDLLEQARKAKNGFSFKALYDYGKWSGLYKSQSEADLALCDYLAFWTAGDVCLIDELFRKSALYRPKWDEKRGALTYGQLTIFKAVETYL